MIFNNLLTELLRLFFSFHGLVFGQVLTHQKLDLPDEYVDNTTILETHSHKDECVGY